MPGERYRHIFLTGYARTRGYTNPRGGSGSSNIPKNRDRSKHSEWLSRRLAAAWEAAREHKAAVVTERHGTYIEFAGEQGFDLMFQSLEHLKAGVRLLNVRKEGEGPEERTSATVYVPHNNRGHFLRRIRAYATKLHKVSKKPMHAKLIDSISDIQHATLRSFWRADEWDRVPQDDPEWLEVWLSSDQDQVVIRFEALLDALRVESSEGALVFPERAVKLIRASRQDLEQLLEASDDIAELRAAKELATHFVTINNREQAQLVRELLRRCEFNSDGNVAVCVLDKGVNNGHQLLGPVLDASDMHAVVPAWGVGDDPDDPHGTLVAGTAAYGDLLALLNSKDPVVVSHRIESAKILPPAPDSNPKDLWGLRTIQGVYRAEVQAPSRKRAICMAITSTDSRDRGRPSSWSAALDEASSGYADDMRRLFIVSGGNVDDSDSWLNYPQSNITDEIHDPGQAWNAITVGAYTEKTAITDKTMSSWSAVAPAGGLSPFSTTSSAWPSRKWPIKPDLVFEGGNVARGPGRSALDHEDLLLLSTYHDPSVAQFAPFNATSASSALASWMAAQIFSRYPDAWPETVRGLMIHTAEWTRTMRGQFISASAPSKADYAKLLRVCGYGVPSLERALYCAANSLTLIAEEQLQPFDKKKTFVTRDMHLYDLPWPTDILLELGETEVRMRITLSYFIEPGPGEVGWDNRYRYASHGLRFGVNGPGESRDEFVRRVNKQARDDGESPGTAGPTDRWVIGDARNVGSVHSDTWVGKAVDLATSHMLAIYPTVGWWRERHHLGRWNRRTRYALLVSIQTPEQSENIYLPVAQQVRVPIPVEIHAMPKRRGRGRR